jgi:5-methylcytosine-specific restriction protein A
MPRPLKPCAQPGCPELVKSGRCPAHRQTQGGWSRQLYSSAWDRYSAQYRREHPLCISCEARGITTPSQVVDHVLPPNGDERLFWDSDNHQALCRRCHGAKTATQDGGYGR